MTLKKYKIQVRDNKKNSEKQFPCFTNVLPLRMNKF